MAKIGIDVHKVATQVCMVTETGEYASCAVLGRARATVHGTRCGTPAKQIQARRARKRQVVEMLLIHGADAAQSDKDGETAMHAAAMADEDDRYVATVIARLARLGARADEPNRFGVSPLMLTVQRGGLRTTQVLLDAGASPLMVSKRGETPLTSDVARFLFPRPAGLHALGLEYAHNQCHALTRFFDDRALPCPK